MSIGGYTLLGLCSRKALSKDREDTYTCHDCSTRRRKGIMKHPKGVVIYIHQEKVGSSNKTIWVATISKGKGVAKRKKGN